MSEPNPTQPVSDRRDSRGDRRAEAAPARRASKPSIWTRYLGIAGRDLLIILGTVAAIVVGIRFSNPIFSNQPKVVAELTKAAPAVAKAVLGPEALDTTHRGRLVGTP